MMYLSSTPDCLFCCCPRDRAKRLFFRLSLFGFSCFFPVLCSSVDFRLWNVHNLLGKPAETFKGFWVWRFSFLSQVGLSCICVHPAKVPRGIFEYRRYFKIGKVFHLCAESPFVRFDSEECSVNDEEACYLNRRFSGISVPQLKDWLTIFVNNFKGCIRPIGVPRRMTVMQLTVLYVNLLHAVFL